MDYTKEETKQFTEEKLKEKKRYAPNFKRISLQDPENMKKIGSIQNEFENAWKRISRVHKAPSYAKFRALALMKQACMDLCREIAEYDYLNQDETFLNNHRKQGTAISNEDFKGGELPDETDSQAYFNLDSTEQHKTSRASPASRPVNVTVRKKRTF